MTLDEYGARLGKILGAANVAGLDPPADLDELVGACHRLGLDLVAAAGLLLPRFGPAAAEDLDQVEGDAAKFYMFQEDGWGEFYESRAEAYSAAAKLPPGDYQLGPPTDGNDPLWKSDELVRVAPDGVVHVLGSSKRWRTVEP